LAFRIVRDAQIGIDERNHKISLALEDTGWPGRRSW
jgi:hypothetical protein